jgi:hypothetical protein
VAMESSRIYQFLACANDVHFLWIIRKNAVNENKMALISAGKELRLDANTQKNKYML